MSHKRKQAISYIRTSSATNVGEDKDSAPRQRIAIERFAKRAGYDVIDWFDDALPSAAPIGLTHGRVSLRSWHASQAMASAPSSLRPLIASLAISWCRKSALPCFAISA
jgi:hypothetical protein